ncbi:hypothetical protein NW762_000282 [Fusarium torreyae]|uniref:Uncharacterized protein n=1 Tax=Fusarium torreyae TaxID=1237075 RepID=A0A9W8VLH4_9HYPO|nr:hypothetical protein NW762_000282 [Fusarium torreyae]
MPPIQQKVMVKGRYAHREIKSSDIPFVRDDSGNTKFKKAVKEYIDSSKTKSGIPGSIFTKWRDRSERDELYDMARGFLENKGLGFWPDGPTGSDTQLFRYPRDHDRLVSLLAQLFFRVNTQSKQTVARQQAALRKRGFSDSLDQSSSSAIQSSPNTNRTTAVGSPDPISSPIYHRTPSEEIDLYHGPKSEDEYRPAVKRRGKRSAAAPTEEQSQLAKLPRHNENDLRDPFESFAVSPFQIQTQSPNVAGQRASFDTIGALGSSPEPRIAEDTTSGPLSILPNH